MKHILILLIICTLNGCGLFKKTSKEKTESRISIELDAVSGKTVASNATINVGLVEDLFVSDKSTKSRVFRADKLTLKPNGNVEAEGNVEFNGFDKLDVDSVKRIESFDYSNLNYLEEASNRIKLENNEKEVKRSWQSDSNISGLILLTLGILTGIFLYWLLRMVFNKINIS